MAPSFMRNSFQEFQVSNLEFWTWFCLPIAETARYGGTKAGCGATYVVIITSPLHPALRIQACHLASLHHNFWG